MNKRILVNAAKDYSSTTTDGVVMNDPQKYKAFRDGQDNAIKLMQEEMCLNMQYYYEYIGMNCYVTPQDWLENHKHF